MFLLAAPQIKHNLFIKLHIFINRDVSALLQMCHNYKHFITLNDSKMFKNTNLRTTNTVESDTGNQWQGYESR